MKTYVLILAFSNYYGVDALLVTNTTVQVARAANLIYAMLMYRREVDREELNPVSLPIFLLPAFLHACMHVCKTIRINND